MIVEDVKSVILLKMSFSRDSQLDRRIKSILKTLVSQDRSSRSKVFFKKGVLKNGIIVPTISSFYSTAPFLWMRV